MIPEILGSYREAVIDFPELWGFFQYKIIMELFALESIFPLPFVSK